MRSVLFSAFFTETPTSSSVAEILFPTLFIPFTCPYAFNDHPCKLYASATRTSWQVSTPENEPEVKTAPATMLRLDACGLSCPGPIIKLKQTIDGMAEGSQVEVTATDPGFPRDAKAWYESTGNSFISASEVG